jgi:hypothetical protein
MSEKELSIVDEPDNQIVVINGVAYRYDYFGFKAANREKPGTYYRIHKPLPGSRGIWVQECVVEDIQDEIARQSLEYLEESLRITTLARDELRYRIDSFNKLPIIKKLLFVLSGKML